jgi:ubiquinone/menaquinone biosynthesis C-methylase UbiE
VRQPNPPAHLLQRIANNPSAEAFVESFEYLGPQIKGYLGEAGFDFADFRNILDFGCGVGRFPFTFQKELKPHQKIWACDVNEECARWCQENIDFVETAHCSINPPLPYADNQFGFIYGLSVFTHLNLDMQFLWAWELYRILEPGGVLFVTVCGPIYFPKLAALPEKSAPAKKMYSFGVDGLFNFISFSGKSESEGQVDVASAHNPDFFKKQFSPFEIVKWFPQSLLAGDQDLYILRKPVQPPSIERPLSAKAYGKPEKWSWRETLVQQNSLPVELEFHLNGQQTFRVYPVVNPAGFYGLECHVEIKAGDRTLVSKKVKFSNGPVFGKTHHAEIELTVPEYSGAVTVQLSNTIKFALTLSAKDVVEVDWCFPNFT